MKNNVTLTVASLLSILFMTFHLTDDGLRQGRMSRGGFMSSLLILVVWLYGTLTLAGRRSWYVISFSGRSWERPCPSSTRWGSARGETTNRAGAYQAVIGRRTIGGGILLKEGA